MTRRTLSIFIGLPRSASILILFALSLAGAQAQAPGGSTDPVQDEKVREALRLQTEGRALVRRPDAASLRQGISVLERSAAIFIEAGLFPNAALTFNQIGVIWGEMLDDRRQQIEAYKKALALFEKGDPNDGGATLGGIAQSKLNLGSAYAALGEAETAIRYYEEALPVFRENRAVFVHGVTLQEMAQLYLNLGSPEKALEKQLEALRLYRGIKDQVAESFNLYFLAEIYSALGNSKSQFRTLQTLLSLNTRLGDKYQLVRAHTAFARFYLNKGEHAKALPYLRRSLGLLDAMPDGNAREYGRGVAIAGLANAYGALGRFAEAERQYHLAVALFRKIGDAGAEASAHRSLGRMYLKRGDTGKAFTHFNEGLTIRRRTGEKPEEAKTLSELQGAWARAGNARMAIFYGKQAVNRWQELRGAARSFDEQTRRAFRDSFADVYKDLADLLVSEGRLPEAQAVLAMLKEEEVFEYVRRDASELDKLNRRADLTEDERAALQKYERLAIEVTSLGTEFSKLQEKKNSLPEGRSLTEPDEKRFVELGKLLEDANVAFQVFLRELADEFGSKPRIVEDVQENLGLQADLKSWGTGVVAVYTIVGDERYRAILTTPEVQVDGKTEIKASDLNRKIAEFRAVIEDPKRDPRPLGKELYDIIVKPIERQLNGAGAKTILWSLDGSLRYVPLAALWDGQRYLGQKYENVIVTLASRTRLGDDSRDDWRVLGLGVTAPHEVTVPGGKVKIPFPALPGVDTELQAIVSEEQSTSDKGVLPGKRLVDAEFTEQAFQDRLGKGYRAVHIASHFHFGADAIEGSFLLLGDGTVLPMNKFKNRREFSLNGVELLTLSACNTAVGVKEANGKEVESFAVIAQQKGAKAVMATLWPVADESTSLLMSEFYRLKKEKPELTKSEALRTAQREMIEGRLKGSGESSGCRGAKVFQSGAAATAFKCDPNAPFSHPYFWAPFVLIGNWR